MTTIRDVAREAGVSIATVSRVFNNVAAVADATRAEVRRVASRLSYEPHHAARSLITRRTATLGLILPDIYGEFFSEVIRGVDGAARERGYHLLVSSSHADQHEIEAAVRLMRGRVDGLIVMAPEYAAMLPPSVSGRVPVVMLGSSFHGERTDAIVIENRSGAEAMIAHLIGLGHRRIAAIAGAAGNTDASERLTGYRNAMLRVGLAPVVAEGDFSESSGFRATRELLAASPAPTAIFALNDAMAIGAMCAIRNQHLAVPDDVAVVGFDDIPMSRYVHPPLTTVHVDISALGARAATQLLSLLDSPQAAGSVETVPTTLVVRRSCGSMPAWTPHVPETVS